MFVTSIANAQDVVPFKLGTFEDDDGERFIGIVISDNAVADIAVVDRLIQEPGPAMPADMMDLVVRYDELRERLYEIAEFAAFTDGFDGLVSINTYKILPPIMPNIMYAAGSNYSDHAAEMDGPIEGPPPDDISGIWQRPFGDTRQNPYVFIKIPSTIIADGEAVELMPDRPEVDYECELAAVIGTAAKRVGPEDAEDYIFGYTLMHDVSDRGGRPDEPVFGMDWLGAKNHDTYGPLGPFIVPKEFVPDVHDLAQTLTLNGTLMQNSSTGYMTHDTFDILSFISYNLTMHPGDIFAMGTPAGVGVARNPPVFMKAGDVAVCSIESIGTLTNPVVATP
ncbi:MAG: fumarylacetoacetate hydrolase family protein, partial [Pseudomonadota bacterium]|nr:fumarylacetoacetate hydrolase family protein [Pseudomonadota bacterium]